MIRDNEYDIISSAELNTILNDLPFNLIRENIEEQIVNRIFNSPNYIDVILEKCALIRRSFESNEEITSFIDDSMREFTDYILELFRKHMDVSIDSDDISVSSAVSLTVSIYNMLIVKYQDTMVEFFYNYIIQNMTSITDLYDGNRKDVTTMSLKKKFGMKKEAVTILANLYEIMTDTRDEYTDNMGFFNLMKDSGNYNASVIVKKFEEGLIADNLLEVLFSGIDSDVENSQLNNVFLTLFLELSNYFESELIDDGE